MHAALLESRPLFGIGTVARLTGLKPDTLRIWERRYGLGASHKSATGRRQYTQSDLEHLQLVSALVGSGVRIGEIASAERKTLQTLLREHGGPESPACKSKPVVVFVGPGLCDWLDNHQGCLTNVDAKLMRLPLGEVDLDALAELGNVGMLVAECNSLGNTQMQQVDALTSTLGAGRVLVTYQYGSERWLKEFEQRKIATTVFPPDPAFVAFELSRSVTEKATGLGNANLGELTSSRPRQFSEEQLSAARTLKSALDCECPRHITDLVRALASFEEYSGGCSVENWQDAAVHSCIYAYTGQARWLMERALQAVLDQHRGDGLAAEDAEQLDNAA
jgi:hypothetical protein